MAFPMRIGDGWELSLLEHSRVLVGAVLDRRYMSSLRTGGRGVNGLYPLLQPRASNGVETTELSEVLRC